MNDLNAKKQHREKMPLTYRALMGSFFAYYITDACWGLFAGLNWIPVLFFDTTVYYVAMAAAVVSWCFYVTEYLHETGTISKIFRWIGISFFVLECGFLIINIFTPCFFWFDENDAYQAGTIRYAALWIQVLLFIFTVILTGRDATQSVGLMKKRYLAIFFFSLTMLVFSILQITAPLLPFYAIGCIFATTILHVFVLEDEREEAREIIEHEKNNAESASRAKSSFLFNMSHDIRTPMNAILGFTAMAKKHTDEPEKTADYLNKIDIAGNQLLRLVNQVLEMSRIESGKITLNETEVNLPKKIDTFRIIYEEQARMKNITLSTPTPEIIHENVLADDDRLVQVLNNITGNALKYTMDGGTVTLTMKEEPCEREEYALYVMTVQDTGIGMSEEFLKTVFDEFSRENTSTVSKIQGTGLGMSIVKKLTELMGGTIDIQSEKGKGTTVAVTVPLKISLSANAKNTSEVVQSNTDVSLQGMKILLVEDNEMNREIAAEILQEYGMAVTMAEDGDIAVDIVSHEPADTFDLILMDVQMPRMNGYDATKAIRSLPDITKAQLPIIAMTANAFEEDRLNALEAGMDEHLAKPIDIQKLIAVLAQFKNSGSGSMKCQMYYLIEGGKSRDTSSIFPPS